MRHGTHRVKAGKITMHRFYWLIDGALAGCSRPGNRGRRVANGDGMGASDTTTSLDEDLDWLRAQGIGAVLSLTEAPLPPGALVRHGLNELHLAVDDLHAPSPAQLQTALAFLDRERARAHGVAVHCLMGQGRTGTVLAAYLIRGGLSPGEALAEVRAICPGAIGSAEQEEALRAFAARRDWII